MKGKNRGKNSERTAQKKKNAHTHEDRSSSGKKMYIMCTLQKKL